MEGLNLVNSTLFITTTAHQMKTTQKNSDGTMNDIED
jgi:hypothetical protein